MDFIGAFISFFLQFWLLTILFLNISQNNCTLKATAYIMTGIMPLWLLEFAYKLKFFALAVSIL